MPTFQMRTRPGQQVTYTGPLYHASFSRTPFKIMGHINLSGPQRVDFNEDNGGIPPEIHTLFERYPGVQQIALVTPTPEDSPEGSSFFGLNVVYSRIKDD